MQNLTYTWHSGPLNSEDSLSRATPSAARGIHYDDRLRGPVTPVFECLA